MLFAFVNLDKWNALPKYYQAVLEQAGHYANTWMMAKYDQLNPPALKRLLAGGTKLHVFSPRDHGSVLQGGEGAARRNRQGPTPSFKKVYDSMMAFTKQRLSVVPGRRELTYDSFMIRHMRG